MALRAAPAAPFDAGRLSPPLVSAESFAALARHVPRGVIPERLRTLAPSRELLRVDLHTARAGEPLPLARARFRVRGRPRGRAASRCGSTWASRRGSRLQTRAGTTWTPMFLPVDPLPRGPGRLSLELDWNAAPAPLARGVRGRPGRAARRDHSPLFAWGAVRPALPARGLRGSTTRPSLTGLRGGG